MSKGGRRSDSFRPHSEPARTIYDAFQEEAQRRDGRSFDEWSAAEIDAVHAASVAAASLHGLRAPTREEIVNAEIQASGHVDYGLKWTLRVVEYMRLPWT